MLLFEDMKTRFSGSEARLWPRAWIDPPLGTERIMTAVFRPPQSSPVEGVLGLGLNPPDCFRGLLTAGNWFDKSDDNSILLPIAMAKRLGLDPETDVGAMVQIFGSPFRIAGYFDGALLDSMKDLDQNPVAPAYLEVGQGEDLSEVEVEALQGGEELLPQAERLIRGDLPPRTSEFILEMLKILMWTPCLTIQGARSWPSIRSRTPTPVS